MRQGCFFDKEAALKTMIHVNLCFGVNNLRNDIPRNSSEYMCVRKSEEPNDFIMQKVSFIAEKRANHNYSQPNSFMLLESLQGAYLS